MSGNEYASRCHSHQQKVIANRHEFDTYPLSSTTWPLQVAVQGRAVVTVVSRWPASVVAVVLLVSISPRHRVRCAKKFALRARNTPNLTFLRLLGEFCRGLSGGGAVPGEFCRVCRPSTVPGTVPGPTLPRPCRCPPAPRPGPSAQQFRMQFPSSLFKH